MEQDNTAVVKTSPYATARPPLARNVKAALDMLSVSEGTFGDGDNGYNVLVGGTLFHSYADHPRIIVDLRDKDGNVKFRSTAAGRYQEKESIFDAYKGPLGLKDFGPNAQDAIALQLLKETHALPLILAGNIVGAITAARSRWASLPGAGYGQFEQKMSTLVLAFQRFGGTVAS